MLSILLIKMKQRIESHGIRNVARSDKHTAYRQSHQCHQHQPH
ncbi:Uncharacterised protein [Vibrio cholerae]|nr:Uncharacterised protein [Vibrio cholerae]CSC53658.1 Uncharacterised protein [Vibrio cholerae]CSI37453.1 Uncharacterised protein [Vibrio cholerae]